MSDDGPPPPTQGVQDGCTPFSFYQGQSVTILSRCVVPHDTIRVMLATDNHIGYMERDPIRGQDSIDTFKEVLQLAVKHDVFYITLFFC